MSVCWYTDLRLDNPDRWQLECHLRLHRVVMNKNEIVRLVKSHPSTNSDFRVCCEATVSNLSRCRRAYRQEERNLYILLVDVDPYTNVGHWVAVYFSPTRESCFWDSYGSAPSTYGEELYHFICELSPHNWIHNQKKIQHDNSCLCGAYTVYFAVKSSVDLRLSEIVKPFTHNTRLNDESVYYWLKKFAIYITLPPPRQLLECDFEDGWSWHVDFWYGTDTSTTPTTILYDAEWLYNVRWEKITIWVSQTKYYAITTCVSTLTQGKHTSLSSSYWPMSNCMGHRYGKSSSSTNISKITIKDSQINMVARCSYMNNSLGISWVRMCWVIRRRVMRYYWSMIKHMRLRAPLSWPRCLLVVHITFCWIRW